MALSVSQFCRSPEIAPRGLTVRFAFIVALLLSVRGNWLIDLPAARAEERAMELEKSQPRDLPRAKTYMGRQLAQPMSYDGASWLVRSSREREERPQQLYEVLRVQPGQAVCDYGCGNGYHTLRLARHVGPRGKVYAVDIQEQMLSELNKRAATRGVKHLAPLLVDPDAPELPRDAVDLVLMVDVYHELGDPLRVLAAIRECLRREGRLVLVEYREEDPGVPIRRLHKMSKPQVQKELTAARFKLTEQYDQLPWQHVMIYSRTDSDRKSVELRPWKPKAEAQAAGE